jgi:hypothetical protein
MCSKASSPSVTKKLEAGTVRSVASAEKVRASFAHYGDRLSFAIVLDMTAADSFEDTVVGVQGVIYTASPFSFSSVTDNETDLLIP